MEPPTPYEQVHIDAQRSIDEKRSTSIDRPRDYWRWALSLVILENVYRSTERESFRNLAYGVIRAMTYARKVNQGLRAGTLRQCAHCGDIYPATIQHFYRVSPDSPRLRGECKSCHSQRVVAGRKARRLAVWRSGDRVRVKWS